MIIFLLRMRAIPQEHGYRIAHRVGEGQATRTPVDVTEPLTRQRDHRRINHGSHLLNMVEWRPVEEDFISILQRAQIKMLLQAIVFSLVGPIGPRQLLLNALDVQRQ
jgi:hypothetical protein